MKTVLIPTDFSRSSENAIKFGLSLLQQNREPFKVLLLNTFLVHSPLPTRSVAIHDEMKKTSLTKLEMEKDRFMKEGRSHVSFEIQSYMGSLDNVMAFLIQDRKIDYIILGMDTNSNSEAIAAMLKRIKCPLLIVPFPGNYIE